MCRSMCLPSGWRYREEAEAVRLPRADTVAEGLPKHVGVMDPQHAVKDCRGERQPPGRVISTPAALLTPKSVASLYLEIDDLESTLGGLPLQPGALLRPITK